MRNASAALIALLNGSTEFAVADCLTIIQADGTITRLTSNSQPVTVVSQYDGLSHTFNPTLPFSRGATKLVIGTEVDHLSVTLSPDPAANLLGGIPWPAAARAGALDNAEVLLEKCIMATFGVTTPGTLILFWGVVGTPTLSRSTVVLEVQSDLILLQSQMPRNLYQPGCLNSLFDGGCTLVRASFLQTGNAQTGSTASEVEIDVTEVDGFFDQGTITFTSGANDGESRFIRAHASDVVTVAPPFPTAPVNGDDFEIVPGCDKKLETCDLKFSNLAHFRGFPVIPAAESAR